MTKMIVRLSGPGIQTNSFAALPKTIYVALPRFARIEDPPDARQGLQKLMVVAEPNAYSVNLIDKKGTHVKDPKNEGNLHVPIVLPFDPKHKCAKLDRVTFGSELDFFKHAGAKKEAGPIVNAKPTDAYVLEGGKLVVNGETEKPIKLSWDCGDGEYSYEYTIVEDLPFDPKLFEKPPGIQWKEIAPEDGSESGS